jgi:membrane protease YdiL (CAAX protease family)
LFAVTGSDSGTSMPDQDLQVPIEPRAALSSDDALAARLRGFGPVGVASILGILAGNLLVVPLSAILVLLWARRSHTPWREIGYVRPVSWVSDLAVGICCGAALKLLMKAVVMPLLGADPINPAYHHLVGNTAALPGMLYAVVVGAGFGEETVFRGYLFERFGKLFGAGVWAKTSIVLLTSALFGLAHYPEQGLAGVQQAMVVGLVFGTTFAVTGRIWMLMCAHAAFDVIAVAIIYWNLEVAVAHLVFK